MKGDNAYDALNTSAYHDVKDGARWGRGILCASWLRNKFGFPPK